jgi:Mn-dependent DtxR family transcriptional regulator
MSSGIANRQKVFRAVLEYGGKATTPEIEKLTGLSTPTVLEYMRQLGVLGLARFTESRPSTVELMPDYVELVSAPTLNQKEGETVH